MLYDGRIAIGRRVPTRANCWHDFLNALVWGTFPRSKQALHSRQHRAIAARIEPGARVLPPTRTRELDALALLDEGGVIVSADDPEPLKKALRFDTHSDRASASHGSVSTGVLRNAIASGQAEAIVFGHAIFESLVLGVAPAAVAAFVRPRGAPNEPLGALDRALADALGDSARFGTPTELCRVELNEVAAGAVISQRTR
jgi:hypothetical protein